MLCLLLSLAPQLDSPAFEEWSGVGPGGARLEGRLGRLEVPLDWEAPEGATIEIAFVHIPSRAPEPGPPIVFLAGGPGGSGIRGCVGPAAGRTLALLDHGDVIGIDQRGTGLSVPNLEGDGSFVRELPPDVLLSRDDYVRAFHEVVAEASTHWKNEGFPLEHFDTTQSARDVDAVRRALGLDQIVLFGSSYGTHLGLEVLRRHPEGVARALLSKVEGPDHTYKLPSTTQAYLEQFAELVRADPGVAEVLPDAVATLRGLIERLAERPARVMLDQGGEEVTVVVGPHDLRDLVANDLGQAFRLVDLPARIAAWEAGDWTELAEWSLMNRRVEPWSAMSIAMDCASGASPRRAARLRRERGDERFVLGDAVNGPYPDLCDHAGAPPLGRAFWEGAVCEVPVLFVSGSLDARTPPSNVEDLLPRYPNAAHVLVENVGHEGLEVLDRSYVELARTFLDGGAVESTVITCPPPRFDRIDGE